MGTARIAFCMVAALIVIVTTMSGVKIRKKKGRIATLVRAILIISNLTVMSNVVFFVVPDRKIALIAQGFYFICIDYLLLYLTEYVRDYTNEVFYSKIGSTILYILIFGDVVSIVVNCFNNHVFDIAEKTIWGIKCFVYYQTGFMFSYHIMLTIVLVCSIITALFMKLLQVSKFYRKKYRTLLILLVIVAIADIVYIFVETPIDFSLIVHSIFAIFMCYFTFFFMPKGLVEKTLSLVVKDMNNTVLCFDINGRCLYINDAGRELFKLPESGGLDVLSEYFAVWSKQHADELAENYTWVEKNEASQKMYEGSYDQIKDANGKIICYCFQITDVTEETKAFRAEQYKVRHDMLTGLYNREYFFIKVGEVLKEHPENSYIMIALNIKGFKIINDLYGEDIGDKILITIGNAIKSNALDAAVYGRLSADYFALCTPAEGPRVDILTDVCEKAEKCIEGMYKLHLQVGVYEVDDVDMNPEVIWGRARTAMKQAGEDEQVEVAYYSKEVVEKEQKDRQLVAEFDKAIDNDEFTIWVQPIVDTEGNFVGGEACARWEHPEYGIIKPEEFLELFEKTNLVCKMDEYIWDKAASLINKLDKKGFKGYISVNVSSKDYYYFDLYEILNKIIDRYDIGPERLRIEITEESFDSNSDEIFNILEKIKNRGFIIQLDDFGTGYSSLNMLKDISVDGIKLNITQMFKADDDPRLKAIMEMIFDLTTKLDIDVVAESVESSEQYNYLKTFGCESFQGYHIMDAVREQKFLELATKA